MDSPSISFATSPTPLASSASTALAGTGADAVRGADFANVFKHLMTSPGRQELAVAAEAGFQSLPLSPNIDVITADAPLPDSASLLAFARSQGLDDATLKALFTAPSAPAVDVSASRPQSPVGAVLSQDASFTTGQPANLALDLASDGDVQAMPGSALEVAPLAQSLRALVPPSGPVAVQVPSVARFPSDSPAFSGLTVQAAAAGPLEPLSLANAGLARPGQALQGAASALALQASADDQTPDPQALGLGLSVTKPLRSATALAASELTSTAQANTEVEAAHASEQVLAGQVSRQLMQDAVRLRLQAPQNITLRLAAMAASGEQALWGQISNKAFGEQETLVLGLTQDWASEEPTAGDAQAMPAPASVALADKATRSPAGADPRAQTEARTAADRLANYEQLAQRLGRALGDRLQAQIQRGEWKVQMQVDPAALGRIEMELDMRSGGLDAVFRSDNALTRELIAQGLPRLRESLSQSGTAVANVWVQGDSSRQSGGNPTPGREDKSASSQNPGKENAAVAPAPQSRKSPGGSALDLMA